MELIQKILPIYSQQFSLENGTPLKKKHKKTQHSFLPPFLHSGTAEIPFSDAWVSSVVCIFCNARSLLAHPCSSPLKYILY